MENVRVNLNPETGLISSVLVDDLLIAADDLLGTTFHWGLMCSMQVKTAMDQYMGQPADRQKIATFNALLYAEQYHPNAEWNMDSMEEWDFQCMALLRRMQAADRAANQEAAASAARTEAADRATQ